MISIEERIGKQFELANKVRGIVTTYFTPPKEIAGKTNRKHHMIAQQVTAATEVMVSLTRIFKALETFDITYLAPIIVDLSFGLSENPFWKEQGGTLVPIYKNAMQAAVTSHIIGKKKDATPDEKQLAENLKTQWHTLFIAAYACLYSTPESISIAPELLNSLRDL